MNSRVTRDFLRQLAELPTHVQDQAARACMLWQRDPYHSSLQFKRVSSRQPIYSARVGIAYRALGLRDGDDVYWFWIGPHDAYDDLLKRP